MSRWFLSLDDVYLGPHVMMALEDVHDKYKCENSTVNVWIFILNISPNKHSVSFWEYKTIGQLFFNWLLATRTLFLQK